MTGACAILGDGRESFLAIGLCMDDSIELGAQLPSTQRERVTNAICRLPKNGAMNGMDTRATSRNPESPEESGRQHHRLRGTASTSTPPRVFRARTCSWRRCQKRVASRYHTASWSVVLIAVWNEANFAF